MQRNTGSYGKDAQFTLTRGDTTWKGAPAVAMTSSLGTTIVQHAEGGTIATLGRDGQPIVSFDPPLSMPFPMRVGAAFIRRELMTMHAAGKTLEYELTCKVESFERVTVRAGTFDTFRIQCTTSIGNEESWWVSPAVRGLVKSSLRRAASSPLGAGTQEAELVSVSVK